MNYRKALVYRIGAGKAIGLVFGLLGFFAMPYFLSDPELTLRWGILLWYTTLGAVVGVFGVFSYHPVLNMPMPWWLRGFWVGAWFNFVLALLAYEQLSVLVAAAMGEYSQYASPFLLVIEGALIGLLIDYALTRWFGEGWGDQESVVPISQR